MSGSANITSTDAVKMLKVALQQLEADFRDAIDQLILEGRRGVEWVEQDRARYWPREARKADEAVIQARNNLERAEMVARGDEKRSCVEQKQALAKAKQRLRLTEAKVRAVKKWRIEVHQEWERFQGQIARLSNYLDTDFPKAIARLDRMMSALEKYTERVAPTEATGNVDSSEPTEAKGSS